MLILGSQSPRRKEILSFFKIPFQVQTPLFDEKSVAKEGDAASHAMLLAAGKAHSFPPSGAPVLCADTLVEMEGKIFEKPEDDQEAYSMLQQLNGNWHTVYTAVSLKHEERVYVDVEATRVQFHEFDEKELKCYHEAFVGTDMAGGYGIQEAGSLIVRRIEGCFYNVMGLPISTTRSLLQRVGYSICDLL